MESASDATLISTFREYEARDFKNSKILGHGGTCVVYKMKNCYNEIVIVKVLRRRGSNSKLFQKVSQKEVQFLKDCQHSNIVKMLGMVKSGNSEAYNAVVFEYHHEGSLENVIMGKKEKGIFHHLIYDQHHILSWATQLSTALVYLHEKGLVHNDLKPDNVLMADKYLTVKLANLGSSGPHGSFTKREEAERPTSNDVYAMGLILWQLNYRQKPCSTKDKIHSDSNPDLTDCNEVLKNMIERCWDQSLQNSWNSKELLFNLSTWLQKILACNGNVIPPPVLFQGLTLTLPPDSEILKFSEYTLLPFTISKSANQLVPNNGQNDPPIEPSLWQEAILQIGDASFLLGRDAIIGIEILHGIVKLFEKSRRDFRGPNGPGRGQVREVERTVENTVQAINNFYQETTPRTKPENYKYCDIDLD